MGDDKTLPEKADTTGNPISRVESRVVPTRAKASTVEPRVVQARRTLAALAASASNPPLLLRVEFKLVGLGMLRTTTVGNFLLVDENTAAGPGFILSFEYRGRDVLKHVAASEKVDGALRKMLFEHGLVFKGATSATVNKLTIDPVVPASIAVAADRTSEKVTITLRNVAMLGSSSYVLPLERFDHKLIETLVDLITTQSHEFYTLVTGVR